MKKRKTTAQKEDDDDDNEGDGYSECKGLSVGEG
jgi:hypothetical protein